MQETNFHSHTKTRAKLYEIWRSYGVEERARLLSQYSVSLRAGRPGDRGSIPAGAKDFSCSLCVQTGSGAHPTSCTMGTGVPFPRAKSRLGRDADHLPLSNAEVENE
jgi:hypothetical protein